jgi:hypothetical protein
MGISPSRLAAAQGKVHTIESRAIVALEDSLQVYGIEVLVNSAVATRWWLKVR